MDPKVPFETELYTYAKSVWPTTGKHILASVENGIIIVYQAYNSDIAQWVTTNQTFKGCPKFSMERMTWIKPNFLWMMYRSGWANKVNQEHILALHITEDGFRKLLGLSKRRVGDRNIAAENCASQANEFGDDDVRIQWDPDHDPYGQKVERRAIQLGIRGAALKKFVEEWVVSISDITDFVKIQYKHVENNELELLQVPVQRVYDLHDAQLENHIGLDDSTG